MIDKAGFSHAQTRAGGNVTPSSRQTGTKDAICRLACSQLHRQSAEMHVTVSLECEWSMLEEQCRTHESNRLRKCSPSIRTTRSPGLAWAKPIWTMETSTRLLARCANASR